MSMKRTLLEKLKGKKIESGIGSGRGGDAQAKREQALAHKRALIERLARRKPKPD